MTGRGWRFVLIAVVAILALGAMFALGRSEFVHRLSFHSAETGGTSGSTSATDPGDESTQPPHRNTRLRNHAVVLPPADTPAADAIAQLKDAADQGSGRAACRVAFELGRCRVLDEALGAASALSGSGNKSAGIIAEYILNSTDADASRCKGVTSELTQAYHYQVIAAQSGDPAMQRWLMQDPALTPSEFIAHLDEWADYKRRVGEYAPLAVHRKQLGDLIFLLGTYAPSLESRNIASVFLKDDAIFLALMDAARDNDMKLSNDLLRSEAVARNSLSGDERLRYEALSSELSGRWRVGSSSEAPVAGVGISGAACSQVAN